MNVEELSTLSIAELRERADTSLEGVSEMSAMERQHHLVDAQFYIDEIERRAERQERAENAKTGRRDFWLEIAVIILIGIEIVIGLQAIHAGDVESDKQVGILNTLKSSVDTLNGSTKTTADNIAALSRAQGDTLETEKRSLTAMRDQLGILREDQKQMQSQTAVLEKQWERQNQAPSLLVIVGTNVLQPTGILYNEITKEHATPPYLILALTLRNVGTATLRRPKVRADVESEYPAVTAMCILDSQFINYENPCHYQNAEFPDIAPDANRDANPQHASRPSDLNLSVVFMVPEGAKDFTVRYTISGENFSAGVYSMHVSIR